MARRIPAFARPGSMLACAAIALSAAGCGGGAGVADSKIVDALNLKHTGRGYEMNGDPFCTISELLNDSDEVSNAHDNAGQAGFVIAARNARIGVLAQRPFAPDCSHRAQKALNRLERRSD